MFRICEFSIISRSAIIKTNLTNSLYDLNYVRDAMYIAM